MKAKCVFAVSLIVCFWCVAPLQGRLIRVDSPNTLKTPKYSAHRGCQSCGPENSLPAFQMAGRHKAWAIETDLYLTRDSEIVCMHDVTLERTVGVKGKVTDYTLAELRQMCLKEVNCVPIRNKSYDYSRMTQDELLIPTFAEYLAICRKYHCVPFIELKTGNGAERDRILYPKMFQMLKDYGFEGKCVISSVSLNLLKQVRALGNKDRIHLIFAKIRDLPDMIALGNGSVSFNVTNYSADLTDKYRFGHFNPRNAEELVDMCHRLGLKICFRAADTPEISRNAIKVGADFLPTNCMWTKLLHNAQD